ncbi:hypothetical protein ACEQ6A_08755 [Rhizobium brockwellii]|uniref:hypothetical protein n=1 Tax=Rhizobium brockwellii TaxID=3019932 RepID=UPI003F9D3BFC
MASNNDNNTELAMGLAALTFIGIFFFALLIIVTFVLTLVAFYCWNEPRKFGKTTITPRLARGFVYGGLAGAVLLPVSFALADIFFNLRLDWDSLAIYFVVGGYIAGAFIVDDILDEGEAVQEIVVPMQSLPQQPNTPTPRSDQPYRFASWDDEEQDQ